MKKTFWRAINGLSHSISIGAILLLLLNDHVLRQFWPSRWTGKVGDFAWLVFFPFVLAAILAWLIPSRLEHQEEVVGRLAFVLTGLGFTLAKTLPVLHDVMVRLFEMLTGWKASLLLDPTDLVALPALLIGWQIWTRMGTRTPVLPRKGWVALSLAVLTLVADAAAPDYGVSCLVEQDSKLIAPSSYHQTFLSEDGGLTWREESSFRSLANKCESHEAPWQISDTTDARIRYRFTPGVSIEKSEDGAQTWKREISLYEHEARTAYYVKTRTSAWNKPGPLDALAHHPTGNVIVAMGYDGVLIRTADNRWRWIPVGPYHREELSRVDRIWSLLYGEFWLAVILALLIVGTLAWRTSKMRLRHYFLAAVVWGLWGLGCCLSPALLSGYDEPPIMFGFMPIVTFAAILWGLGIVRLYRLSPHALALAVVAAMVGLFLFLLPYVVWSQGGILSYVMAQSVALFLAVVILFAGDWYLQRFLKTISRPAQAVVNP